MSGEGEVQGFPFDFDPHAYEIREGIEGVWHYHLAEKDQRTTLCGQPSMETKIPISSWMSKSPNHIPMTYCEDCQNEAQNR